MTMLNLEKHKRCFNYEKEEESTVESKMLHKDEVWKSKTIENRIIFVREGDVRFELKKNISSNLCDTHFIFIPSGEVLITQASEYSDLLILRIQNRIQFCPSSSLESLNRETNMPLSSQCSIYSLKTNDRLQIYLENLEFFLKKGLLCKYYFKLKIEELFLLLKILYSREELSSFFSSMLTHDVSFSNYIFQNHSKHHTLNELAQSMNYSTSGFEKKFKKVFGVSGYKWMKEQKIHRVYEAICTEPKNFKEIATELGFSSESYFYDFCKTQIGLTPSQIRKIKKTD